MNNSNEISKNGSQVNTSTHSTNRRQPKRTNRTNSSSPRRSKRTRPQSKDIRKVSAPSAMGSHISADNTSNEFNNQNIESNEETVVRNETQNNSNSVENDTQITETNNAVNVCIDLTQDDSVVDENNAESDSDIQCISTVVRDSDLCIVRVRNANQNRVNRRARTSTRPTQQNNEIIEIQDTLSNTISPNEPLNESGSTPIRKSIKCPVCLDELSTIRVSGKQLVSTNCGHLFCDRCIKEVIKTSKSCPTCRKKIATQKSYHPIYL